MVSAAAARFSARPSIADKSGRARSESGCALPGESSHTRPGAPWPCPSGTRQIGNTLRVTRRDELYGALAERAGPVEEHNGALINAAAAWACVEGSRYQSFYGLTFTAIIVQMPGIVLCRSSSSCRASLCVI